MKLVKTANNTKRLFLMPRMSVAAVLVAVVTLASAMAVSTGSQKASAEAVMDCTTNSIIMCGAQTPADFVAKLRANDPADLQTIYNSFTLTTDKYDDFAKNAKMGMAYQNGTLIVDGQTVATDTWSIGREKFSYSTNDPIGGQTYYKSKSTDVMKSDLPAMVYFGSDGKVQFAVLTACGNPLGGTRVPAGGSCDMLQKTVVSGQDNTYSFTTKATAKNGSKVTKVVYDFGDGSATVSSDNPATPVNHTYSKPGNWTAKVTAFISNAGGADVPVTATSCQTAITVAQPTPPPTPAPVTPPAPVVTPAVAPQPAATLPATGPAGVAGIFGGASALGALGYQWRTRRRNNAINRFVDRFRNGK